MKSNSQCVTAEIVHFRNGSVLQASTSEWVLRKHLYKATDTSAYINLARVIDDNNSDFLEIITKVSFQVLAQRCLESGLTEMLCTINPEPNGKVEKFLKTLQSEGVRLEEAEQYKPARPWDKDRPEKPWEVTE